jgi:hypothetical protein
MAISALMRLGLGARFFKDQSFADRVEIFEKFSRTETFYRPLSEYQREFGRVDMSVENVVGLKIKLRYSENSILSKLEISGKISQLYSVFHQIYFTAVKIAA